ncbi:ABC transporter ATP-binding protein [Microlunatus soli]|uniref:ATP-binding cassette, subfamily B n=1 Tax=Microlunatus soli TaxID=630515 RepID=A0A1H1Z789_9ACTN|nr:ABC transporter ATP-binding protein [Microlunatus soli]SDT29429.1 ATP-binding cassette, subfamily B [Microlunatus soli]
MIKAFRAVWLIISTSVRVDPLRSVLCLAESAGVAMAVLRPMFLAWMITGAGHRDLQRIVLGAALFVASIAADKALCMIGVNARIRQLEKVSHTFQARVAEITARIPTLDHLESPQYLDQSQLLRERSGTLGVALNTLLNTLNDVVRVGGTLILAAAADRRVLLIAVAGIPLLISTRWFVRWQAAAENSSAQPGRLTAHLLGLASDPSAGAEIMVFDRGTVLRRHLHQAALRWRRPFTELARRTAAVESACHVLYFMIAGVVLAWLVADVLNGLLAVGSFVLALLLVNRIQSGNQDLLEATGNLIDMIRTTMRLLWLLDYRQQVSSADSGQQHPPRTFRSGITLDRVSYRYSADRRPAVDEVSLRLPAGTVVAVVGENGAGKTTLVKLLTGMYRPTDGLILIDDVDLAQLDTSAWRCRISAAFQDYLQPQFLASEAIGLGDPRYLDDRRRLRSAARRGTAETVIDQLPAGLDTQLGAQWPDGVDLSGGQWQRIALARGMMRDDPLLLVLDEPTAALDAATENDLFERYAEAARSGSRTGMITLLITHRFSTVAAADLIIVLDHGRLIEVGTHRQLLRSGGHYAELYRLQSKGYRR